MMPKLDNDNSQQTFELSWDEENDTEIDLNNDNIPEQETKYQAEQNNELEEYEDADNNQYQEQYQDADNDQEQEKTPDEPNNQSPTPIIEYEIDEDEPIDDTPEQQPQNIPSDTIEFDELSIAEILLEARAKKQLTIRDVAERTNIQANIIKSLEKNGTVINLAPIYLKSRIKSLCQEYQIDHEPVLKKYIQGLSEEEQDNNFNTSGQYGIEETGFLFDKKKKLKLSMLISGVALLGVVIVVILGIAHTKIFNKKNSSNSANQKEQQIIDWNDFATPRQLPVEELEIPKN